MEDLIFQKMSGTDSSNSKENTIEKQLDQIKNQIIAYKYMIKNINIPNEVLEKISNFQYEDWETTRQKSLENNQEIYEKKFENHDLVL
jgi:hypothetical protein